MCYVKDAILYLTIIKPLHPTLIRTSYIGINHLRCSWNEYLNETVKYYHLLIECFVTIARHQSISNLPSLTHRVGPDPILKKLTSAATSSSDMGLFFIAELDAHSPIFI